MSQTTTNQDLVIALDGLSSCGKSTVAKGVASALDYIYIDSGAMYRAVTLYFMENNIDVNSLSDIEDALENIELDFRIINGENSIFLNGANVEQTIRNPKISSVVSKVSAIPLVRDFLQEKQREYGKKKRIVMDGRDIGTVIFPNADLKLFLIADRDIRTDRRYLELQSKGIDTTREDVLKNISTRDHIDSTRSHSPLKKADDAIVLDNSQMTKQEQLEWILDKVKDLRS